jgi:hypothetical protein
MSRSDLRWPRNLFMGIPEPGATQRAVPENQAVSPVTATCGTCLLWSEVSKHLERVFSVMTPSLKTIRIRM